MDSAIEGALIGAGAVLASLIVSQVFQAVSQSRERKHRRQELVFKHACDFTHGRLPLLKDRKLSDDIIMLDEYYRRLAWLFDKGRLPPDVYTERLIGASGSVTDYTIAPNNSIEDLEKKTK